MKVHITFIVPAVGLIMAATQTQARDSWFGVRRHDPMDPSQSDILHDKDGQADMSQAAEIIHASTAGPSDLPTHTGATSIFAPPSPPPNSVHGSIFCPNSGGDPLCSTTTMSAHKTEATMINPPRTADEALFSFGFVGHLNEKLGHVVEKVKEAAVPRKEDEQTLNDDGDTKRRFFAKRGDAVLENEKRKRTQDGHHDPHDDDHQEEHAFRILPILDRVKRALLEPETLDYEYAADQPGTEDNVGYEGDDDDEEGDEMGRVRNDSILARVLSYLPYKSTGRTAEFVTDTSSSAATSSTGSPKQGRTAEFVSSASQSLSSATHKATEAAKRAVKDLGTEDAPVHVHVQQEQDPHVKHQTEGKVEHLQEQAAHAAYQLKDEFDSAVDQAKDQMGHSIHPKRKRSEDSTRSWLGFVKRRRSDDTLAQKVQEAKQHAHEAETLAEQKAAEAQRLLETKLKHAQHDASAKVQEAKDAAQKKKHEFEQSAKDAAAALKKRQAQDEADRKRAAEEAKRRAHVVVLDQKQHEKEEAKRLAVEQALLKKRQAKEEADRKAEEKRLAKLEAKRVAAEKASARKAEVLLKKRESERMAAEKKQLEKREAERKRAADRAAKAEAAALRKRQDEQAAIEKEAAKKRAALEAKIKAEAVAHEKRVAAESKKHAEAIKAAQDKILAEEKAAEVKKQQVEKAAAEELKKRQDQEKKAAVAAAKKEAADAKKKREASEKL
ncbi:hypothetical protein BGZ75_002533 [Mortierella antarctica]|nr:hypothetical protein BGZ75_002533 [Mortierella antarctica]